MADFYAIYPSTGGANPSVGPTGDPIPSEATLIGGENPSGDLTPVQTDVNGNLIVSINDVPGSGLATAANQVLEIADLDSIESNIDLSFKPIFEAYDFAGKVVMIGVSDGDNEASPLYSDAGGNLLVSDLLLATALRQEGETPSGGNPYGLVIGGYDPDTEFKAFRTDLAGNLKTTLAAGTEIIGKVAIDQTTPGTTTGVQVNAALPVGTNSIGQVTANAGTNLNTSALNLEVTQSAMSAKLPAALGQGTMAQSMSVAIASNQSAVPVSGTVAVTGVATSANQTNGTQKTQIVDASGNVVDTLSSAGVDNLLIAMGATNYVASSNNSSVVQLTAGSTFTGVIETIFNQQAISVLLTSDQNGTLVLKQYIDAAGVFLANTLTYSIVAGTPFSRAITGNGNYFNLTFTNNGGSTTTTLNINTAYGTLPAVTVLGNTPSAINEVGGTAITLGQKTSGASFPVVLSSDQSVIGTTANDILSSGNITTQNLVPTGAATAGSAVLSGTLNGQNIGCVQVTGTYTGALSLQGTVDGTNWITFGGNVFWNVNLGTVAATITTGQVGIFQYDCGGFIQTRITGLAAMTGTAVITNRASVAQAVVSVDSIGAGSAIIGALVANQSVNLAQVGGVATATSSGSVSSATLRTVIASGPTPTTANVASSATNVTLLASAIGRLGATFFNDSTQILYLKFGATASATSYTVQLLANDYYELPGPHMYNGIIDGIWASANGNCRVTSW